MPKAKNPKAQDAENMFKNGLKLVEIAKKLDLPEGTIRRWKSTYKWRTERSHKKANVRNKGGAPFGNKNATGPPGNRHAEKYGFFSKHLPEETLSIIKGMPDDPLDILWDQIQIAYAAIIRAQKIMFVTDKKDMSKEMVMESVGKSGSSEAYTVQFAWDKHASFLRAQARAQSELRSLIKRYDEQLHEQWELTTEEQRCRVERIRLEINQTKGEGAENSLAEAVKRMEERRRRDG